MIYTKAPQLKKQFHAENAFQVCFNGHILTNRIILLFIEIMMLYLIMETDKMLGVTSHFTYIGPAFIRMLIVLMIEKKIMFLKHCLRVLFLILVMSLFLTNICLWQYATILKAVKMIIFS